MPTRNGMSEATSCRSTAAAAGIASASATTNSIGAMVLKDAWLRFRRPGAQAGEHAGVDRRDDSPRDVGRIAAGEDLVIVDDLQRHHPLRHVIVFDPEHHQRFTIVTFGDHERRGAEPRRRPCDNPDHAARLPRWYQLDVRDALQTTADFVCQPGRHAVAAVSTFVVYFQHEPDFW